MKPSYDFSVAERGKFYHAQAEFRFQIYLEPDVKEFIEALAIKKKTNVQELVNSVIKNNIQLYQSYK